MKVICSFSLLLRLAFWLTGSALLAGAVLGRPASPAPVPQRPAPVVLAHGKEVR